jgi:hypothetical protein
MICLVVLFTTIGLATWPSCANMFLVIEQAKVYASYTRVSQKFPYKVVIYSYLFNVDLNRLAIFSLVEYHPSKK